MWYKPHSRIRSASAANRAAEIARRIRHREPMEDSWDETILFAAQHTCAFQAKRACERGDKAGYRRWACRWRRIRDYLVESNLGLVYSMMSRLRLDRTHRDELNSEGLVALVRAVERFDPWRNIRFSTYACNLIVRDLINLSRRTTRYRNLFPYHYDETFEQPAEVADTRGDLYVERLRRALNRNLAGLTDLESNILQQRFPMDNRAAPKRRTLQEIGNEMGVSKERVRQIQMKALGKLREVLDSDPLLKE